MIPSRTTRYSPTALHAAPRGFAALLVILIIMAVAVAIGVGFTTFGLSDLQVGLVESQSAQAFSGTESCLNESLLRLKRNWYYRGGAMTVGGAGCTISVTESSPTTRFVATTSTVGNATRAVQASVTLLGPGRVSSTISWEEPSP